MPGCADRVKECVTGDCHRWRRKTRGWLLALAAALVVLPFVQRWVQIQHGFQPATILVPGDSRIAREVNLTIGEETRTVVMGKLPPFWVLPSGPPVAIVNGSTRTVLDATLDIGDDGAFIRRWPGVMTALAR
jgi:hypothetical protein